MKSTSFVSPKYIATHCTLAATSETTTVKRIFTILRQQLTLRRILVVPSLAQIAAAEINSGDLTLLLR